MCSFYTELCIYLFIYSVSIRDPNEYQSSIFKVAFSAMNNIETSQIADIGLVRSLNQSVWVRETSMAHTHTHARSMCICV